MYGVTVNLIGCSEQSMPPAAREILHRWAVVDIDYPTVMAVQNCVLEKEGETRLFIIHVDSADDVSELKRLSGLFPRYPILAVVDATTDPTLVTKSMRAGALQVVHPPVMPDDLQEALDCIAAKHEGLGKVAQLVTVTSSVGGCGGTAVAINLTHELARLTRARSILMELALRKGVVANHLGITPLYTTTKLVNDIGRVDSFILQGALTEVAENFCVLAGPYDTIQTENPSLDGTMQLIQLVRHLSTWLVLDVPSTYDDLYFRSLAAADRIVVVADQSVAAVRGVQMLCDTLGKRRPIVVINRYNPKTSGLSVDRLQKFLPGCQICTVANDPAVVAAMNGGQPLARYAPRSPVLSDIDALVKQLEPDAQTGQPKSILRRLGRALSQT
ncbi:MAG TPA: cellulose synthase operon protein YhjQ/BcsQ [Pirellulales bacterium]|jgi:pilus assembly protein CpaE|nr:cellulose synthase operon protein YhjQ/BcsQ [Pirellulales bacterium]